MPPVLPCRPWSVVATLLALAACGTGSTPAPEYAPLPDDPRLPPTGRPAPGAGGAAGAPDAACIPAGTYDVAVDLSAAVISQANTGMDDTVWCQSMLEAVPAQMMASMTIAHDGGALTVAWPPGHPVAVTPRGPCSFSVTTPPMPATFVFDGGVGRGTSTYTIGTQNHPDESCTATGATIAVTALPPLEAP